MDGNKNTLIQILPLTISKGQLSQAIYSRITCSRLLGKICTRFDSAMWVYIYLFIYFNIPSFHDCGMCNEMVQKFSCEIYSIFLRLFLIYIVST